MDDARLSLLMMLAFIGVYFAVAVVLQWLFSSQPDPCNGSDDEDERFKEIEKYNGEWLDKPMDHSQPK